MNETPRIGGQVTWAAVPFKGPNGSKRRLAPLLGEDERARLSLAMLDDVLDALLGVPRIEQVLLLTPTGPHANGRDAERLTVVPEPGLSQDAGVAGGLNSALSHAQAVALDGGAARLLIVPADLPSIGSSDVAALLDAADGAATVIAPDRAASGTNALLLAPPAAVEPSFGEGSFVRHRTLIAAAGLTCSVVSRPGLALDLDTPTDVAVLLAASRASSASRLLRSLDVAPRLEAWLTAQARSTTIRSSEGRSRKRGGRAG